MLPNGGFTSYGTRRLDYSPTAWARKQAAIVGAGVPMLSHCGCCEAYHPATFYGDCRNDLYRIDDPDSLFGTDGWTETTTTEGN